MGALLFPTTRYCALLLLASFAPLAALLVPSQDPPQAAIAARLVPCGCWAFLLALRCYHCELHFSEHIADTPNIIMILFLVTGSVSYVHEQRSDFPFSTHGIPYPLALSFGIFGLFLSWFAYVAAVAHFVAIRYRHPQATYQVSNRAARAIALAVLATCLIGPLILLWKVREDCEEPFYVSFFNRTIQFFGFPKCPTAIDVFWSIFSGTIMSISVAGIVLRWYRVGVGVLASAVLGSCITQVLWRLYLASQMGGAVVALVTLIIWSFSKDSCPLSES